MSVSGTVFSCRCSWIGERESWPFSSWCVSSPICASTELYSSLLVIVIWPWCSSSGSSRSLNFCCRSSISMSSTVISGVGNSGLSFYFSHYPCCFWEFHFGSVNSRSHLPCRHGSL